MNNYKFGEVFESDAPMSSRPSRSTARARKSYNEDLIAPSFGENDDGIPNPCFHPCYDFMQSAGILDDFMTLVGKVGLTEYMQDERHQYVNLTKIFVESFSFNNSSFNPSVSFKIYNNTTKLPSSTFCSIIGVSNKGTSSRIKDQPADLLEIYRGVTNDDSRTAQRGKIRNIQLPSLRYFAYYLASNVLGRENTSNISNYHLAFLVAALEGNSRYNLGVVIARRLAARGPIFGGIIASRMAEYLGHAIDPNDEIMPLQRLDLDVMKGHRFVTANSTLQQLVYRMVFLDGTEREIPLPQSDLFDLRRKPWSRSKD